MADSDTVGGCTVEAQRDTGRAVGGCDGPAGGCDGPAAAGGDSALGGRETIGKGMWLDFGVNKTSRSVVERF